MNNEQLLLFKVTGNDPIPVIGNDGENLTELQPRDIFVALPRSEKGEYFVLPDFTTITLNGTDDLELVRLPNKAWEELDFSGLQIPADEPMRQRTKSNEPSHKRVQARNRMLETGQRAIKKIGTTA